MRPLRLSWSTTFAVESQVLVARLHAARGLEPRLSRAKSENTDPTASEAAQSTLLWCRQPMILNQDEDILTVAFFQQICVFSRKSTLAFSLFLPWLLARFFLKEIELLSGLIPAEWTNDLKGYAWKQRVLGYVQGLAKRQAQVAWMLQASPGRSHEQQQE